VEFQELRIGFSFVFVLVSLVEDLFLLSEPGACGSGGGSFTGGAMGGGWLFNGVFSSCVFNRLAVSFDCLVYQIVSFLRGRLSKVRGVQRLAEESGRGR
jgi:hypothetical protein